MTWESRKEIRIFQDENVLSDLKREKTAKFTSANLKS